jgi:hypothetical protein
MGTGKSTIVAAAIRTARTVVMASFRRAFTAEKSQQFGLQSYEDFGFMPRIKCDKLICQVESLHKIDFDYRAPEVLILDEIQSIISQFNSNLAPATNQDSIRAFRELVRCAGRVFVLDAYMTSATIDMIREMRAVGPNGPREAIVYKNVFKPLAGMTTTVYNCKAAIATAIIERAKAGEHIVVCSDTNKWLSQVYEKLRAEGVVDAMLVTGDNSAAFAENVRKNGAVGAASARVFLYNTALLAGVDIAGAPHKKLFAMFTNRYISANHAMQLMGRFRGIESIGIAFDERTVYEMTLDGYLGSIASSDWENLHTTIGGKFAVIKRDLNKVGKLIMQGHVNDHNSRIHFAENVLGTLAYHGARIVAARYTEQTALPPAVIRPNEYRINELFGVNDIKKLPVAVAADVQNPKIQHLQAVFNNIGDDTFDMHNLMNQLEIQRFERDDLAVEPQEIPGGELDVATQRHTFAARINHAKHQILAYRLLRALHVPTDVRVLGYAAPIARDVMEGWVRDIPLEVINQRTYCKFKPLMTNEFNRKLKIINTIIESAFGFRVIYTSRRRIDGQQVCTDYILKMNEKFAYDPTRNKYFLMALIVIPRIVPQEIPPEEPPEQHPDLRPTNDPPG